MKYAVFSDIHGNKYAFEAMLNDLRHVEIEGFLFCGDFTGYYYHAREIIEAVEKLTNFYAVRGNHDELLLRASVDGVSQHEAVQKFSSSYKTIDTYVVDYIHTLPKTRILNIGAFNILMLHGSPVSPLTGRIYPDSIIDMQPLEYDFLFIGNTHYQMIKIYEKNCKIVNPGSLGQPRDGKGFSYFIVDFVTGDIDRKIVDFDLTNLLADIAEKDSELPYLSSVLERYRR